jgi:hypothetical protein
MNIRGAGKSALDYVTRRFNASSARTEEARGLDLRWKAVLRDLQFPGFASGLDCSSCSQQHQQKIKIRKYDNSTLKRINWRVAIAARFCSHRGRALLLCAFGASG